MWALESGGWAWVPAPPLPSCATLHKSLDLFEAPFLHERSMIISTVIGPGKIHPASWETEVEFKSTQTENGCCSC